MTTKTEAFASFLDEQFPNAGCTLTFRNAFECVCAVLLSAQTNDLSVNKVTPRLFSAYPTPFELSNAREEDVEQIIASLGLYRNKAKNLIALAKACVTKYGGEIPLSFEELILLPGVGVKTANVALMELTARPSYAVDTHVSRVAKRLGFADEKDDALVIEAKLEKRFPKQMWVDLHHRTIAFGRPICHAKKPECERCNLGKYCRYFKKISSTKGK